MEPTDDEVAAGEEGPHPGSLCLGLIEFVQQRHVENTKGVANSIYQQVGYKRRQYYLKIETITLQVQ